MEERERETHESFGQIGFSRVSSTGTRFYGSELMQDNYISMEVYSSEVEHDLSKDWYYATNIPILRLRMSSGQFAEMITSMNRGMGVPCTIEYIQGKKVADLPDTENRKEFVHRKFLDRMKEFAKTIRDKQTKAKEIVKKKILSKEDVKELTFHLEYLTQEISDNIPFFAKCFQETIDEVVYEAKLEVENAIQHKLTILGMEKLEEIRTEHKQLKRTK